MDTDSSEHTFKLPVLSVTEASTATPVPSDMPEFVRLPRPSTLCRFTGLGRSVLNRLVLPCAENDFKPPVRSFVLRRKGTQRGTRLVNLASLLSYLRKLEEEQNPPESDQELFGKSPG